MNEPTLATKAPAPAVETAARLLDALSAHGGSATLDELTRDVGEPRSSIHRILTTLISVGAVSRAPRRGGYRLGLKVLDWGSAYARAVDLFEEFRAVAIPLSREINETVRLAMLDIPDIVWVAKVDCTRAVRLASEIGQRDPVHASAAGKVFLAWNGALLDTLGPVAAVTPYTLTSPEALRTELAGVRVAGYAADQQEAAENLCSVAAPISPRGTLVAAMSICVCCQALEGTYRDTLVSGLLEASAILAKSLPGSPGPATSNGSAG